MLRRKITDKLYLWKKDTNRLPLLINGARQVGKTTAVLEFAKNTYKTIYQINFFETPELVSIFSEDLSADTILTKLSFAFPETRRKEGSMLIFLDEIQHCPNGRTALKFLAKDPRFDVIATGSLLGINHASERSFPVGYINNIETGKSLPSLTGIFYICEYLDVTPSEFFDMDVSNPSKLDAIVNDMKKLDDRQLDTIAVLVKDLIKK